MNPELQFVVQLPPIAVLLQLAGHPVLLFGVGGRLLLRHTANAHSSNREAREHMTVLRHSASAHAVFGPEPSFICAAFKRQGVSTRLDGMPCDCVTRTA